MNLTKYCNFFCFSLKLIAGAFVLGFLMPMTVAAQDMIARQAPVDRKMKVVDSVAINRVLKRQRSINYEQNGLYTTWETNKVHCYNHDDLPEDFRIDLRGFHMPTPSRVITSNYGYRASFGRMHKGLDIKVYIGDTIVSAFDGKVRVVSYEAKGYGNYVVIRHENGLETIYGHLSKHLCKTGDVVKAGQPIGLGGNTGRSTGSHLHFETRLLGEALDPSLLFDFVAQDVTCDFYDYHRSDARKNSNSLLASSESLGASSNILDVPSAEEEVIVVEEAESISNGSKNSRSQASKIYKVRKGDTLSSISRRVGCSVQQLCSRNGINKRTKLQLGQMLRY